MTDGIVTERLIIRPLDHQLVQAMNYPVHQRFLNHLQKLKIDPTLKGWDAWIVQLKDGTYIGDIGFKGKPDASNIIEIGYGFQDDFHGQGYATESVGALLETVKAMHAEIIFKAGCLKDNKPSINVLKKLGFKQVEEDESFLYWKKV